MLELGDLVYCSLRSNGTEIPVSGWIVELPENDVILATVPAAVEGVKTKLLGSSGDTSVAFIRVPQGAVFIGQPADWKGPRAKDLSSLGVCRAAWKKHAEKDLQSSEAEAPTTQPAAQASRGGGDRLSRDLHGLAALFGDPGEEEDEESEDDEPGMGRSYLAPGQSSKKVTKGKSKDSRGDRGMDQRQLLLQGLAGGADTNAMMQMMMLNFLMEKSEAGKKKKKKRQDRAASSLELLGGSSSESSEDDDRLRGKGMRAVATLKNLHDQIQKRPKRICELFEREVVEELGIVPGQAWTLKDYVRRQNWGRFKSLYRAAIMDVAVYEALRAGKKDEAAAQLVQNLKSKIQAVLQGGDWSTAWLLTGLADPLQKKEWAGSREEMAIISGYVEALHNLKKKVKESQNTAHEDPEDEGAAASAGRK